MFAVIKTGGKQYLVKKNQILRLEKIPGKEGDEIEFAQVLLLADDKKTEIGQPVLSNKKVKAQILKQGRAKKIEVIKYKSKTRYKKKQGHRQPFTQVKILAV